jgi:hypothetical protein
VAAELLPAQLRNTGAVDKDEAARFATGISDFATLVRKSYYGVPSPIDYSGLAKSKALPGRANQESYVSLEACISIRTESL